MNGKGEGGERQSAERERLLAAGWKPEERDGETIWENPETGMWHEQETAISLLEQGEDPGGVS